MFIKYILFIFLIIVLAISSCSKKDNTKKQIISDCDSTGTISYKNHIVPIINVSCGVNAGACHNATSSYGDFNSYQGFISHPASHIIHCVKQDDQINYKPMPLGANKLSSCNIAKIVNWVNEGRLNN